MDSDRRRRLQEKRGAMKRRDFFKAVTGFVAGIFASSVEGKKKTKLRDFDAHLVLGDDFDEYDLTIGERLGCKDCFVGCEHFDECLAELKKRVAVYDAEPKEWINVRTYGANDDTKKIQEAIDPAAKDGGEIVHFPKGTYNLKYGIII